MENKYSNNFTGTLKFALRTLILVLFLFSFTNTFAQNPVFNNETLLSGTAKQAGAVYKYTNVKTVNGKQVDAIVTLNAITGNARLDTFDNATNGNYPNRFQPEIRSGASNGLAYVEFQFDFYETGTYNTATAKRVILDKFTLEAIDVDGGEFFDIVIPSSGSYSLENPTNIAVTPGTATTFTRFLGPNSSVAQISLTATFIIARVDLINVSSVIFRLGSTRSADSRQSSISFGEVAFNFPSAPVANDDVLNCITIGSSAVIDVTANDNDANDNLDVSTVDLIPSTNAIDRTRTVTNEGAWTVSALGVVTFKPAAGFIGNPTPITYTIRDKTLVTPLKSNEATITIKYDPVAPTASAQSFCSTDVAKVSNLVATGTGVKWYTASTGGTALAANTALTERTYYASQTIDGCESPRTPVVVTITPAPNAGTLSGTQAICVDGATTFSSNATGGTWSTSAAAIATINASTGVVKGLKVGTATMTYTVKGTGGCDDATATRVVTVTAAPNAGTLSGIQAICVDGTTTLTSTTAGGTWSTSAAAIATINASTGVVKGLKVGTATMTYTVKGTGGCDDATATRVVTVTAAPNVGTLSGIQAICVDGTTTFSSTITGGTWSTSAATTATINASTGAVKGLKVGTATMTYTVKGSGGCDDATATRVVTVTAAPD
ncbi:hypothetical protein, partial [Flavobacterium sp. 14A]|uniref:Ig-like domain-containing protein n=1 Tax=Flavobacterium sp. 14A TaxID=2735896 RepID=UPI001C2DD0EF